MKIAPGGACIADEQCRDPLDKRCGAPVCRKGACGYEIGPGEFIANQFPGDCRINYCDFDGEVQWAPDTSDPPIDLNDCTFTGCVGSDPSMLVADDGTPCVSGFCVAGRCVECSEVLGAIFNCGGSSLCDWEECVPSYCKNGVKSPGETDTDCGGPHCRRCDTGSTCFISSDCASGVCSDNACQAATHNDGIQNGNESGPDCGYLGGPLYACEDGQGCNTPFDCISGVCYVGVCQPSSCLDDRLNGTETKTDCGGSCPPCP